MTPLSMLWRPGQLDFTGPGLRKRFPVEDFSGGVEIRHPHGNVVVEVKNGTLAIGFPLASQLVPTLHLAATYRRLSTTSPEFYPEITVRIPGVPELVPRL